MKIIDFHCHIYPDKISEKATSSISAFYNIEMSGTGSVAQLKEKGKEAGISNYLVHSVAVTAEHVKTINDFIANQCGENKEFYGFGTMHADFEDKIGEIQRFVNMGLKGVKIHPDTQRFDLDDERMFELYDYISQMQIPILIHTGDYRYSYSHPEKFKRILHLFPKLVAIGAHFGGWSVHDLAYEYLAEENCYLDTSSSFMMMGMKRAKELIRLYGAERILFGTDFPMWNAKEELEKFYSMSLTNEENELILYKNAEKILKV